jgi:hypothetical protein
MVSGPGFMRAAAVTSRSRLPWRLGLGSPAKNLFPRVLMRASRLCQYAL